MISPRSQEPRPVGRAQESATPRGHVFAAVGCLPVDIEEARVAARLAVPQDIEPPGIVAAADRHVVRHDIDDEAEPGLAQRRHQAAKSLLAAKLGIDPGRIDPVIAVPRALARHEDRRGIDVADAERSQIGRKRRRIREGEALVENCRRSVARGRGEVMAACAANALGARLRTRDRRKDITRPAGQDVAACQLGCSSIEVPSRFGCSSSPSRS